MPLKPKHRSPTPSDASDYDSQASEYSDDDTKHSSKAKAAAVMHKVGDKLKSGYKQAKSASADGVKSLNKNMAKLKVTAVKQYHKRRGSGSEDSDDAASEYANRRKGVSSKQQHSSNDASDASASEPNSGDDSDADSRRKSKSKHKPAPKLKQRSSYSSQAGSSAQSSAQPSPHSKKSFFSFFKRKPSVDPSELEAIDLAEYDGDLSYLYAGTKTSYNKHVNTVQRKQQLYQWYTHIVQPDILPAETSDIKQILLLRNTLLQHKQLVYNGVPGCSRMQLYSLLSGSQTLHERMESVHSYSEYVALSAKTLDKQTLKYIKADLTKVLNSNAKFLTKAIQISLYNILCALCTRKHESGYCTNLSHIVAFFLLFDSTNEESIFWLTIALQDIVLPVSYFERGLVGARADTHMMKLLLYTRMPKLYRHLQHHNIDISIVSLKWFLCLYTLTLPLYCTVRIFDILMLEGSNILLQIGLAIYKMLQQDVLKLNDTVEIMQHIDHTLKSYTDIDTLLHTALHDKLCAISKDDLIQRNTERKIMESSCIKELQFSQLQQQEKSQRKQKEAKRKQAQQAELLDYLQNGIVCYKIPRSGKVKQTIVKLAQVAERADLVYAVQWESKKKTADDTTIKLNECMLYTGMKTGNFIKRTDLQNKYAEYVEWTFSLVSPLRSLDLICECEYDYKCMVEQCQQLIDEYSSMKKIHSRANSSDDET